MKLTGLRYLARGGVIGNRGFENRWQ